MLIDKRKQFISFVGCLQSTLQVSSLFVVYFAFIALFLFFKKKRRRFRAFEKGERDIEKWNEMEKMASLEIDLWRDLVEYLHESLRLSAMR
jgi:hypothetical protein